MIWLEFCSRRNNLSVHSFSLLFLHASTFLIIISFHFHRHRQMFGNVRQETGRSEINRHNNFANFFYALLLLFRYLSVLSADRLCLLVSPLRLSVIFFDHFLTRFCSDVPRVRVGKQWCSPVKRAWNVNHHPTIGKDWSEVANLRKNVDPTLPICTSVHSSFSRHSW